jgi:hypothetical protein
MHPSCPSRQGTFAPQQRTAPEHLPSSLLSANKRLSTSHVKRDAASCASDATILTRKERRPSRLAYLPQRRRGVPVGQRHCRGRRCARALTAAALSDKYHLQAPPGTTRRPPPSCSSEAILHRAPRDYRLQAPSRREPRRRGDPALRRVRAVKQKCSWCARRSAPISRSIALASSRSALTISNAIPCDGGDPREMDWQPEVSEDNAPRFRPVSDHA